MDSEPGGQPARAKTLVPFRRPAGAVARLAQRAAAEDSERRARVASVRARLLAGELDVRRVFVETARRILRG